MTDREFETVALAIKAAYPNSNVLPDKYAMKVWYRALGDLDFKVAENAVWEHISTSTFPPSIAEIREKCTARLSPMVTDWGEAWEEVQRAIRKYGRYREEEALASMTTRMTEVAVRRMGFQNLCSSENPVADRAHFQRMYEGMVKEERRQTQLPEFVRSERIRLIESHMPPVPQIECTEKRLLDDVKKASPNYIDRLMQRARKTLCKQEKSLKSMIDETNITMEQIEENNRKLEETRKRMFGDTSGRGKKHEG